MIINIKNKKNLNATLTMSNLWSDVDSFFLRKYCEFSKNSILLEKLESFEKFLSGSSFLRNNENYGFWNKTYTVRNKEMFFKKMKEEGFIHEYRSQSCSILIDNIKQDPAFNETNYCFLEIQSFKGASSNRDFKEINQANLKGLGLEALADFLNNKEMLVIYEDLLTAIGESKNDIKNNLNKLKRLIVKMDELEINEENNIERLVSNDTFLIYFPDSKSYLDYKGNRSPLSGARLFETSIQAKRTATSRNILNNIVIVKSNISLVEVTNETSIPTTGLGALSEGIAELEKIKIKENLKKVTLEDLENQIKELKEKLKQQGLNSDSDSEVNMTTSKSVRKRM